MKGAHGFVQACNAQVAVEPNFELIVGQLVTQDANDKQQMQPVVEAIREQSGQKPAEVVSLPCACTAVLRSGGQRRELPGGGEFVDQREASLPIAWRLNLLEVWAKD